MDYQPVIAACEEKAVGDAVADALARLFANDLRNLQNDTHERTIAEMLAGYLRPHFEGFDVNVEYNRMGDAPKEVTWRVGPGAKPERVYPDIIVHRRFEPDNVLAIEMKKGSNAETKDDDVLKLRAYRSELGYRHALFIRLGVGKKAGSVSECEWVFP
jgi:hypothetical protein